MKPKKNAFDAQVFLQSVGVSRRVEEFRKKQAIFSQGEPADSVMYVQKGSVKQGSGCGDFWLGVLFGEGGPTSSYGDGHRYCALDGSHYRKR
jgi:CRP-like cAMP-binding protein